VQSTVKTKKKEADDDIFFITIVELLPKQAIISHVLEDQLKISPNLARRSQRLEDT
jgi:hypothetical protein